MVIHLPRTAIGGLTPKFRCLAYEEFASADDDVIRQAALRRHLDLIRGHIKGLSERNYHALYGLKSLDFVLMFVPIEPAFMVGVTQDNKLFMDAWTKNVLRLSPSTLLFVVRTVAHLWRQEAQSRNAQDIAERGAQLDAAVGVCCRFGIKWVTGSSKRRNPTVTPMPNSRPIKATSFGKLRCSKSLASDRQRHCRRHCWNSQWNTLAVSPQHTSKWQAVRGSDHTDAGAL